MARVVDSRMSEQRSKTASNIGGRGPTNHSLQCPYVRIHDTRQPPERGALYSCHDDSRAALRDGRKDEGLSRKRNTPQRVPSLCSTYQPAEKALSAHLRQRNASSGEHVLLK